MDELFLNAGKITGYQNCEVDIAAISSQNTWIDSNSLAILFINRGNPLDPPGTWATLFVKGFPIEPGEQLSIGLNENQIDKTRYYISFSAGAQNCYVIRALYKN